MECLRGGEERRFRSGDDLGGLRRRFSPPACKITCSHGVHDLPLHRKGMHWEDGMGFPV